MTLQNDAYTSGFNFLSYAYEENEDDVDQSFLETEASFSHELDNSAEQPVSSTPGRLLGAAPRPLPRVSPQITHKRGRNHTAAHLYCPPFDRHNWYEHTDAQIRSLMDSQNKLVAMFENFSERVTQIEKAIDSLKAVSSTSASPEEKSRVPPQLSVSFTMLCSYVIVVLFSCLEKCWNDT